MMFIGIDPDLHKSGIAIAQNGELIALESLTFPELIDFIRNNLDAHFVVENVSINKPTFYRGAQSRAVSNRISQNVGQVKAIQLKIVEMLEHHHCNYSLKSPLKGELKRAKKDAKLFKKLTGWKGRTNEDKRDAAMLIFENLG